MIRNLAIFFLVASNQTYAIDVIAHRGYACADVENSIPSIQRAWRAGADGVEVDVRVSSDGVVYLFHDDKIAGTKIAGLTYSAVASLSDQQIPTLPGVLDTIDAQGYYVFDLKTNELSDLDEILRVVRASRLTAQSVSFQSERVDFLEYVGHDMPNAKLTFLTHLKWKFPYLLHPSAKQLVSALDGQDIDRVSIKGRSFIDKGFIDTIKATGREVHIWTINDRDRAAHYKKLGADGLITDRVEAILGRDHDSCSRDGRILTTLTKADTAT